MNSTQYNYIVPFTDLLVSDKYLIDPIAYKTINELTFPGFRLRDKNVYLAFGKAIPKEDSNGIDYPIKDTTQTPHQLKLIPDMGFVKCQGTQIFPVVSERANVRINFSEINRKITNPEVGLYGVINYTIQEIDQLFMRMNYIPSSLIANKAYSFFKQHTVFAIEIISIDGDGAGSVNLFAVCPDNKYRVQLEFVSHVWKLI